MRSSRQVEADGGYEILCGNRRKRACELAGRATMPVIIRVLDDAGAALVMVFIVFDGTNILLHAFQ